MTASHREENNRVYEIKKEKRTSTTVVSISQEKHTGGGGQAKRCFFSFLFLVTFVTCMQHMMMKVNSF